MPRTIFSAVAAGFAIMGALAVDADYLFKMAIVFALLAVAYKE